MRQLLRTRRKGFSLIELLIVVAIIAALVGVAVPFFQDNLSEAQRTKAAQDLEVIKKAIALYDARESRPLVGTALDPLLGRYMQELPKDPWGNDYLLDGAAGVLASFGADALPEGSGGDQDIVIYTKPPLMINRVQYQGSWGKTKAITSQSSGNKFIISLTKPTAATNALEGEITLIRTVGLVPGNTLAGEIELDDIFLGGGTKNWEDPADSTITDNLHRPENGVIIVHAMLDTQLVPAAQSITPTMALDFACVDGVGSPCEGITGFGDSRSVGTAIRESTYQGKSPASPLDTAVYGAVVGGFTGLYRRLPQPMELVSGQRRGVKLEKY